MDDATPAQNTRGSCCPARPAPAALAMCSACPSTELMWSEPDSSRRCRASADTYRKAAQGCGPETQAPQQEGVVQQGRVGPSCSVSAHRRTSLRRPVTLAGPAGGHSALAAMLGCPPKQGPPPAIPGEEQEGGAPPPSGGEEEGGGAGGGWRRAVHGASR
ncbi:unnamed protein product [Lampetra fluviatilis]